MAELLKPGIRARIAKVQAAVHAQVENLKQDIKDLVKWWNIAPTASKRGITLLFLEKIVVFPASARGIRTIEPGRVVLHWRGLSGMSGG
ncbi:hypothetical protein [Streptomyces sp. NPDC026659]|uniref:hypothetical protein n=1 Tax=Streptomyces sp. NPDC026659 TaxID=3155123 RepID=UPI00340B0FC9